MEVFNTRTSLFIIQNTVEGSKLELESTVNLDKILIYTIDSFKMSEGGDLLNTFLGDLSISEPTSDTGDDLSGEKANGAVGPPNELDELPNRASSDQPIDQQQDIPPAGPPSRKRTMTHKARLAKLDELTKTFWKVHRVLVSRLSAAKECLKGDVTQRLLTTTQEELSSKYDELVSTYDQIKELDEGAPEAPDSAFVEALDRVLGDRDSILSCLKGKLDTSDDSRSMRSRRSRLSSRSGSYSIRSEQRRLAAERAALSAKMDAEDMQAEHEDELQALQLAETRRLAREKKRKAQRAAEEAQRKAQLDAEEARRAAEEAQRRAQRAAEEAEEEADDEEQAAIAQARIQKVQKQMERSETRKLLAMKQAEERAYAESEEDGDFVPTLYSETTPLRERLLPVVNEPSDVREFISSPPASDLALRDDPLPRQPEVLVQTRTSESGDPLPHSPPRTSRSERESVSSARELERETETPVSDSHLRGGKSDLLPGRLVQRSLGISEVSSSSPRGDQQSSSTPVGEQAQQSPPSPVVSTHGDTVANSSQSSTSDVAVLAEALASAISLNRLPPPEPSIFDGDPLRYNDWSVSFRTLIESKAIPSSDKIHYLKRYLAGSAREAVSGYFLLNTETAFDKAKALLDERYGNPFTVAEAFRNQLEAWPRIGTKDGISLRRYGDFLNQCSTAMVENESLVFLNDPREIRKMLFTLPDWLVNQWSRKVSKAIEEEGKYPSFQKFADFIAAEAKIICNPLTNLGRQAYAACI